MDLIDLFFRLLMYEHIEPLEQFHVVDIDPYGSAAVFLDSAVQCIKDGGKAYINAHCM